MSFYKCYVLFAVQIPWRKIIVKAVLVASLIVFSSCSSYYGLSRVEPVIHHYEITVHDGTHKPIVGANFVCRIESVGRLVKDTVLITPTTGKLLIAAVPLSDPSITSVPIYKSQLTYVISKEGYCTATSNASFTSIGNILNSKKVEVILRPMELHQYTLAVIDIFGNPIPDATVLYSLKNLKKMVSDTTVKTPESGTVSATVIASPNPEYTYTNEYETQFSYTVSKEGYYQKSGTLHSIVAKTGTVTLYKPVDYFTEKFQKNPRGRALKAKILTFIDYLLVQSLLTDSYLQIRSIDLIAFKEKDYLTFIFTNSNVYNSLKLDKYGIGKLIFDEVIRKILNPLNENLGGTSDFHGFDLTVIASSRSFDDKYSIPQLTVYSFLIPKRTVERYKNKDISGQQVLDGSIILMDDERIELKLQ